eukprot:g105.t1
MAATIYTVAQQKGGAGKSTLAAHLAVAWALKRKRVALVDIDPQSTLAAWFAARAAHLGPEAVGLRFENVTGWRAAKAVEQLARESDMVVVDSPPHAETEARVAVRAADLVVIPTQPSPLDVWATQPTLQLAAKERRPSVLVLNRVPPRALLTERMAEALAGYEAEIAKARLGARVAFAESMADGLTAPETKPSSQAAKEIRALAQELQRKA